MERGRFEEELLEYVEGRLDPAREAAVRELLVHDPNMRARVEGMRRDREQLMHEPKEMDAPRGGVERAISKAEREALLDHPVRRGQHSMRLKIGSMAAVVAIAGVASWWIVGAADRSLNPTPPRLARDLADGPTLDVQDGGVDLDGSPIDGALAERIDALMNDSVHGGMLNELAVEQEIASAVESTGDEIFSIDELAVFAPDSEMVGPVYVPPLDHAEVKRAVELSGRGRLRLVVELQAGDDEEAAYAYLTDGVLGTVQLAERVEAWRTDPAGSVSADEALPGERASVPESPAFAVASIRFRSEGRYLSIIDSDDLSDEEIAEEVLALASRARELGGALRVHGHEGKAMRTTGEGVRYELLVRWVVD